MKIKFFLFLSFIISSPFCVVANIVNNISSDFTIDRLLKKNGIVIFSTTESGIRSEIELYLFFKSSFLGKDVNAKVLMWNKNGDVDLEKTTRIRAQSFGRLHVLNLTTGFYKFFRFENHENMKNRISSKNLFNLNDNGGFVFNFTVIPGEIKYIENISFYFFPLVFIRFDEKQTYS